MKKQKKLNRHIREPVGSLKHRQNWVYISKISLRGIFKDGCDDGGGAVLATPPLWVRLFAIVTPLCSCNSQKMLRKSEMVDLGRVKQREPFILVDHPPIHFLYQENYEAFSSGSVNFRYRPRKLYLMISSIARSISRSFSSSESESEV